MKIVKNTLLLYSTRFVEVLATLIQIKIITLFLPKLVVGKIFFIIGIASFIATVSQAGFSFVFVRYVPKFSKRENLTLFNFSMLVYFTGLFLSLLIGITLYHSLSFWVMFTGIYVFSALPLIGSYLIGSSKIKFLFWLTLLRSIVLITLIYLERQALTVSNLGIIFMLAGAAVLFGFYFVFPATFDLLSLRSILLEIKGFWKYAFLDQIFQPIFMYLYRIITPLVMNYEALASFTISKRIDNFSRRVFQVPLDVVSPEISLRDSRKDEIIPVLVELKKIYVIFSTAFFLGYVVFGKLLIILISTSSYLDAFRALLILGVGLVISSTYSVDATFLRSIGEMKAYFIHNFIWMVVFIVSFVILGKYYGLSGLAAAYPIGHVFAGIYIKLRVRDVELIKFDPVLAISIALVTIYIYFSSFWVFGLTVLYLLMLTFRTDFRKLQSQR